MSVFIAFPVYSEITVILTVIFEPDIRSFFFFWHRGRRAGRNGRSVADRRPGSRIVGFEDFFAAFRIQSLDKDYTCSTML